MLSNKNGRVTPKSRMVENYVHNMAYDKRLSVRDILDTLDVDKHTVSNTMSRLYHSGIVDREPKPENHSQFNYWKPQKKTDLFEKAMKALSLCNSDIRCV